MSKVKPSSKSPKKVSKKSSSAGLSVAGKALLELALAATPGCQPTAKTSSDPTVKAVEGILANSPWGNDSRTKLVADVASAILGKPVSVPASKYSTGRYCMVVTLNTSVPGYKKGQTVMFKSSNGSHGLMVEKGHIVRVDEDLPSDAFRPATVGEVEAYVKSATANDSLVSELQCYIQRKLA